MMTVAFYTQHFGNWQILGAFIFIVLAIAISRFFKLNLGKDLLVASIRTILQLITVGYVLRWLLHTDSISTNLLVLFVMTLVAAQASYSRLKEKTWRIYLAIFAAIFVSVWPLGFLTIQLFFGGDAFLQSLFFIPFMGVLMGNTLSAISLSFVGLERARRESLLEIETMKALGASAFEACHRLYNETLRNALTPMINGMTVVGIVSLPGVMSGQLIGGVDPLIAARFQILVMFVITFTAMLGALAAIFITHYYFMPAWLLQKSEGMGFNFPTGARVLLQGPSGVGKSRLLKSLVGLDTTDVYKNITLPSGWTLLKSKNPGLIMYVPQKAYFIPGTVLENLQYPLEFKKHCSEKFSEKFFQENLAKLGMSTELLHKNAMTLSGGEAQVVHLLRSLQFKPQVLLLDEITAALDAERTSLVESFLKDWVETHKDRQLVFISHRKEQSTSLANHSLTLEPGKLILN